MSPYVPTIKQVEDALHVLARAAHDKSSDLADLLEEEYEDFRDTLHDLSKSIRRGTRHRVKRIRRTAGNINEQVHDAPWPSIGIMAGGALIAGLLLGFRKNNICKKRDVA
jgi:ElaB/YqjD/DUF883 family membrane-anchored ribosome-binding protein